jgi:large subunit ribosomal protein L23
MGIFDKLKRKPERKAVETPATDEVEKKVPAIEPAAKGVKDATKAQELATNSVSTGILVKPVITEKSLLMQGTGKYTFFVKKDANKHQVAQAVKDVYGIKPVKVRMIKQQAQQLNRWGRKTGMQKARKKAIVTMPQGTTLDLTA